MAIDPVDGASHQSGLSFDILASGDLKTSNARIGALGVRGRRDFETPNFISVSSRGVVPHLTPDVLSAHTEFGGLHMALEDFIEKAATSTPPVMAVPGSSPLHKFTALPSHFVTLLAPRRIPAVSTPNGNSNTAISVFTSTGFQVLSNKAYITYVQKLRPDIVIALADVPHGTVPGTKRIDKMGDRSELWLSELLPARGDHSAIFAPILPIEAQSQSEYLHYLAEVADQIQGFAFYDSNLLPDIPATTALSRLPRLSLDEPASPHHILRQISLGMDIFTIPFITYATDAGIALNFIFPQPLGLDITQSNNEDSAILPLGIDMWSTSHATSVTPLSPSCSCYACTSHHRAFVQHLLSAKEMLGWALLQTHNHHVLSQFFASIRDSIKNRTLDADCQKFAKAYESELPEKSGQGPRIRGYHFKSEGPGEKQKNRPAWGNLGADKSNVDGTGVSPDSGAQLEDKGFAEEGLSN